MNRSLYVNRSPFRASAISHACPLEANRPYRALICLAAKSNSRTHKSRRSDERPSITKLPRYTPPPLFLHRDFNPARLPCRRRERKRCTATPVSAHARYLRILSFGRLAIKSRGFAISTLMIVNVIIAERSVNHRFSCNLREARRYVSRMKTRRRDNRINRWIEWRLIEKLR